MGKPQKHEMTDEEWEIYKEKAIKIYEIVVTSPPHLMAPILIKVLTSIHMQLKGLNEDSPGALAIHDNLQSVLSHALFNTTNNCITERN